MTTCSFYYNSSTNDKFIVWLRINPYHFQFILNYLLQSFFFYFMKESCIASHYLLLLLSVVHTVLWTLAARHRIIKNYFHDKISSNLTQNTERFQKIVCHCHLKIYLFASIGSHKLFFSELSLVGKENRWN